MAGSGRGALDLPLAAPVTAAQLMSCSDADLHRYTILPAGREFDSVAAPIQIFAGRLLPWARLHHGAVGNLGGPGEILSKVSRSS
eukprot:scaffold520788_cov45-Prasinocladus_malaysianus.AAC.1